MPSFINPYALVFDGTQSTADFFSNEVNLTTNLGRELAFYFDLVTTATGDMGITLQFNPNPFNESDFAWQDVASTDLTILNCDTSANLPQTVAGIEGGEIRGGVITAIDTYNLLFRFTPLPYQYRLRFQIDNAVIGSIAKISFTQGT